MKVGVNTYIVREIGGNGVPLDKLKVDAIELGFDDVPVLSKEGINWKVLKDLTGIEVEFTLHAPTSDGRNVSVDLGHYSRMNIITMERVFKIASALNAKAVVIHGGDINGSYHRAFVNTRKQLMEIATIAKDYSIELLVENLTESRIGAFPHELLPFLEENISICLDIGHAFLTAIKYGIPMDEFALLSPVKEMHIHDNSGMLDDHLPPGQGMLGKGYISKVIKAKRPEYAILEIRKYQTEKEIIDAIMFVKGF